MLPSLLWELCSMLSLCCVLAACVRLLCDLSKCSIVKVRWARKGESCVLFLGTWKYSTFDLVIKLLSVVPTFNSPGAFKLCCWKRALFSKIVDLVAGQEVAAHVVSLYPSRSGRCWFFWLLTIITCLKKTACVSSTAFWHPPCISIHPLSAEAAHRLLISRNVWSVEQLICHSERIWLMTDWLLWSVRDIIDVSRLIFPNLVLVSKWHQERMASLPWA